MFLNTLMVDMSYFKNSTLITNVYRRPTICAQDLAANKTDYVPSLMKATTGTDE